jgi:hypothetical protein
MNGVERRVRRRIARIANKNKSRTSIEKEFDMSGEITHSVNMLNGKEYYVIINAIYNSGNNQLQQKVYPQEHERNEERQNQTLRDRL